MHVSPVDDFRHKYGTYSEKVDEAFVEVDREIAEVIAAYEECGYLICWILPYWAIMGICRWKNNFAQMCCWHRRG